MRMLPYKHLPYPINLWSVVFQKEATKEDIPEDWDDTLAHLLKQMENPRRYDMVSYFFKDQLSLNRIGDIYGITREAVRQNINTAIVQLQHPTKKRFLEHGLKKIKYMQEHCIGLWGLSMDAAAGGAALSTLPISELNLGARAYNSLRRANIETIGQIVCCTESELAALRCMGEHSVNEVKQALALYDLSLQKEKH